MGFCSRYLIFIILHLCSIILFYSASAETTNIKKQDILKLEANDTTNIKPIVLRTEQIGKTKRMREFFQKMIQQNVFHNPTGPILISDKRGKYNSVDVSLPTHSNKVDDKPSRTTYSKNNVNSKGKFMPYIGVVVDGRKESPKRYYGTSVALQPDMTVFESIFAAALQFHKKNRNKMNPYNVMLDWDYDRHCETIIYTAGISNTSRNQWVILVKRRRGRMIYKSPCIPYKRMRLRPGTIISLKFM